MSVPPSTDKDEELARKLHQALNGAHVKSQAVLDRELAMELQREEEYIEMGPSAGQGVVVDGPIRRIRQDMCNVM